MAYDSVVCVKQVPDTANVTGEAMRENGTVNRAALPAIFNPEDLNALEAALEVRDRFGGTVTVLTMGPLNACEVLRECLYRGADRAILLTDRGAAGSDTLATGYILNQAIRKMDKVDLVFCGRQAIDGDTAQVGPQTAEKLGFPQITYLEEVISVNNGTIKAKRNVGNGWEILESPLPCLLTVLDSNLPRPQAARLAMKYKQALAPDEVRRKVNAEMKGADDATKDAEVEKRVAALKEKNLLIDQWNLEHVEADLEWCGLKGSPTWVNRIQSIVLTKEGHVQVEPTEDGVRGMIRELIVDRTLG